MVSEVAVRTDWKTVPRQRSGDCECAVAINKIQKGCSATLRVCQIMYRPKQFCAWHATSEMEFHPSQTGADHGAVLPSPGCTRSVQIVVCPLETPSTALRIGPRGERTLRPPRPCVDDDDDEITFPQHFKNFWPPKSTVAKMYK